MIKLKGIAWNHSRGFVSVVATGQRYEELNPHVRISWEKRSLQEFADKPLQDLVGRYDLLIVDHPFTGFAAEEGVLAAYEDYLPQEYLADQLKNSVGASCNSYRYFDKQWALACDAAAPISSWRPDLLEQSGFELPKTWDDLLLMAKKDKVALAAFPVDSMMHYIMLCVALGGFPADTERSKQALELLKELVSLCPDWGLQKNPIQVAEYMTQNDDIIYCPFAYGYSNYSRDYYAENHLKAGGLVTLDGETLSSVLGGAGIAVSAHSKNTEEAMKYAAFTSSPEQQKGLYYEAGGQPGHRGAWQDSHVNTSCHDFFKDTLQTLDQAYVRPSHSGYIPFQDKAGPVVHSYLSNNMALEDCVSKIQQYYEKSHQQKEGQS